MTSRPRTGSAHCSRRQRASSMTQVPGRGCAARPSPAVDRRSGAAATRRSRGRARRRSRRRRRRGSGSPRTHGSALPPARHWWGESRPRRRASPPSRSPGPAAPRRRPPPGRAPRWAGQRADDQAADFGPAPGPPRTSRRARWGATTQGPGPSGPSQGVAQRAQRSRRPHPARRRRASPEPLPTVASTVPGSRRPAPARRRTAARAR